MGLFSKENSSATLSKPVSEYSDSEIVKLLEKPLSVKVKAGLIKEATRRGLTNPKTGKKYHV